MKKLIIFFLVYSFELKAQIFNVTPNFYGPDDSTTYKDDVQLNFNRHAGFLLKYNDVHFQKNFQFGEGNNNNFSNLISFNGCGFNTARFLGPYFSFIEFENCTFNNALSFFTDSTETENYVDHLYLNNCIFKNGLNLSGVNVNTLISISGQMTGKLDLSGITAKNPNSKIDLTDLTPDSGKKIIVDMTEAPIANIILDYENFSLDTASLKKPQTATSIYNGLLLNFKNRGYTKSYEVVDIEYRKYLNHHGDGLEKYFGYIRDLAEDAWWNYGYNKDRIIGITLVSVLLLSLINIPYYKTLNDRVYRIFKDNWQKTHSHFYYSLIYSSAVFFSFTLKLEKLKYESKWNLIWFMLIYIYGLICLAYLANYILKAGACG